jgi:hypothetical protein
MKRKTQITAMFYAGLLLMFMSCKREVIPDPPTQTAQKRVAAVPVSQTPRKASEFANSIGVCISLTNTAYRDHFYDIVMPRLKELSLKHVREGIPYRWLLPAADTAIVKNRLILLHDSLGITVNYVIGSRRIVDTISLRDSAKYLSVFRTTPRLVSTIESFEGFNEPDLTIYSWYPNNFDTLTYKIQKGLYNKVHAMPELANKPVLSPSITSYWSSPSRPNKIAAISPHISNYFDYASFHTYDSGSTNWKMFPGTYYDLTKHLFPPVQQGKPFATTETGYQNARYWNVPGSAAYNVSGYHYLSERSSGKYYSVMFMEQLKRGAKWIYAYELIDRKTSDQNYAENNFGILHSDGSIKPAFTAIKNTIALLKDGSTSFTPTPLTYTITGDTTNIRTYLFQKSDGRYYLAIWQGQPNGVSYDWSTYTDLPDDVQNVTVTFGQTFATAKTYQPLGSINPLASYTNVGTLNLAVPDELLLVELKP